MSTALAFNTCNELLAAQAKAEFLFEQAEKRKLIRAGISEKQLNEEIYQLAFQLFGIRKYWHKRIVRAGVNTLCPYRENPPNLEIQENDLIFFDFGPVFEQYEADYGRTYLLGNDLMKRKIVADLEKVFQEGKQYFKDNLAITGKKLFEQVKELSKKSGWLYGGPHAGHLIGEFPHERRLGECPENYICPENEKPMRALDLNGRQRHWILEVHLLDLELQYGAFYEDLLTLDR